MQQKEVSGYCEALKRIYGVESPGAELTREETTR